MLTGGNHSSRHLAPPICDLHMLYFLRQILSSNFFFLFFWTKHFEFLGYFLDFYALQEHSGKDKNILTTISSRWMINAWIMFKQIVGIPMRTTCPLYLRTRLTYEVEFTQILFSSGRQHLASPLNFIHRLNYNVWLVVLRLYVALVIFQPYRDLEAGKNQSLKS